MSEHSRVLRPSAAPRGAEREPVLQPLAADGAPMAAANRGGMTGVCPAMTSAAPYMSDAGPVDQELSVLVGLRGIRRGVRRVP